MIRMILLNALDNPQGFDIELDKAYTLPFFMLTLMTQYQTLLILHDVHYLNPDIS